MEELKQQFEELTQRKIALWESIKDMTLYELSAEWKEIQALDVKLLELRAQIEGGR